MSIIFGCPHYYAANDQRCQLHRGHAGPHDFALRENTQRAEQRYWRCAHHPSAIENFFDGRKECQWECHKQELHWYHNGTHPMPKSWGSPFPRFKIGA
jgi:hypothetical protein